MKYLNLKRFVLALSLAWPGLAGAAARESSGDIRLAPAPNLGGAVGTPPLKIDLKIPSLARQQVPTLSLPLSPASAPPAMVLQAPAGQAARRPAPEQAASEEDLSGQVESGRRLFDLGAPSAPSLLDKISSFLRPDIIPAWPGKNGDILRLNGRSFVLEEKISENESTISYRSRTGGDYAVKLSRPGSFREFSILNGLRGTDIPHAELIAASPDGSAVVQYGLDGVSAAEALREGPLALKQKAGLAQVAALLIRQGYTADLKASNLHWGRMSQEWKLMEVHALARGPPSAVLGQLLAGDFPQKAGLDPVEFMSALRGRLGPDSPAWREIGKSSAEVPGIRAALRGLARVDRLRRRPARIQFVSAPANPVLDDSWVSRSELSRRLGFDPFTVRNKIKLHTDDPGKTNTDVQRISPPGRPDMVTKMGDKPMMRHEIALRRIVRRFFGKYFNAPGALAYAGFGEAGLVMEFSQGSGSWARDALSLEQRVAMFLLAQTFGLTDVNPGNVLVSGDGRATLIDFEQAFSRKRPVQGRLPIKSILDEMPWVSRNGPNQTEDYLPAVKAWRDFFLKPATQKEVERILRAAGFSREEIPALMDILRANARDLEWAVQSDVEFANFFIADR